MVPGLPDLDPLWGDWTRLAEVWAEARNLWIRDNGQKKQPDERTDPFLARMDALPARTKALEGKECTTKPNFEAVEGAVAARKAFAAYIG